MDENEITHIVNQENYQSISPYFMALDWSLLKISYCQGNEYIPNGGQ